MFRDGENSILQVPIQVEIDYSMTSSTLQIRERDLVRIWRQVLDLEYFSYLRVLSVQQIIEMKEDTCQE